MLLDCGIGKQASTWHVVEAKAPMFVRVYYILGGKTRYKSQEIRQNLQKGWIYLFPAHMPYELVTDPDHPIECLFLHLDLPAGILVHLTAIPAEKDPELTHLLCCIRDGIENGYPAGYLDLLARAFERLCSHKQIFRPVDAETLRFTEALRRVSRQAVPLEQVAAELGYSNEYFIRLFRRKLGVTPHQYIISLRMSEAVRMLAAGASLEEIASSVGYTDGHSFANSFRRYYGISPGTYRQYYTGSV